ncbi:hydroxyacylglutathione hydrolase [Microbulbifer sp. ALW1]|uniref:hydroxyacylglutathione hydrolase n=1 Tax=Microbulbifer sp. (strain ALW1) TaxID=1516059 RepID=UPI0013590A39|nr:hydroxyacylglutathione hydrolase [Microbulbifer sp. ALW1]
MITIHPIPAFSDNYIWHLQQSGEISSETGNENAQQNWVIDPGDAAPVMAALGDSPLTGILLTHHHFDHTGGVEALKKAFDCPVYGPGSIAGVTHPLNDGDTLDLMGCHWDVIAVPGHTLDHIALVLRDGAITHLFCGDTLFAAGCGRLFEGTPEQMHHSLSKLAALPPETRVYCAHEYTLSNLKFAAAADPANTEVTERQVAAQAIRQRGLPTLPSTIALELATNPFLRTSADAVRTQAIAHGAGEAPSAVEIFATLRHWKDNF